MRSMRLQLVVQQLEVFPRFESAQTKSPGDDGEQSVRPPFPRAAQIEDH
jgi:hypothetical protein